jgi:hypothetical protein
MPTLAELNSAAATWTGIESELRTRFFNLTQEWSQYVATIETIEANVSSSNVTSRAAQSKTNLGLFVESFDQYINSTPVWTPRVITATATLGLLGQAVTFDSIASANGLRTSGTYLSLSTTPPLGSLGSGLTVNIVIDNNGAATIEIVTRGGGYVQGETITVADTQLGSGGAPDLTFNVATIVNKITLLDDLIDSIDTQLAAYDTIKGKVDTDSDGYIPLILEISNAISLKGNQTAVDALTSVNINSLPSNKQKLATEISKDLPTYLNTLFLADAEQKLNTTQSLLNFEAAALLNLVADNSTINIMYYVKELYKIDNPNWEETWDAFIDV